MKPEQITMLLGSLNETVFKNTLNIKYHHCVEDGEVDPMAYAEHVWTIDCPSLYGSRVCWLNTRRSWEIRHGPGGDFWWWVDAKITNDIALEFAGTISDEGIGDKWKGKEDYCMTFMAYLERMKSHLEDGPLKTWLYQEAMEHAPQEHRVDLGPKIELKVAE